MREVYTPPASRCHPDAGFAQALRAVGKFLRDRRAVVSAFYVSNVESYLERNGVWPAFCANVASMPRDMNSVFIRYCGRGGVTPISADILRCK